LLSMLATLPAMTAVAATPTGCGSTASVFGEVIISGFAPGAVRLQWTAWEDSSVRLYRVSRHPAGCGRSACATVLGSVRSTAGGLRTYAFVDTAPAGTWWYGIEQLRAPGPSCTMTSAEIVVDAPPACDTAAVCAQVDSSF